LRWNCFLKHVIGGTVEGRIEVTGRRGKDVSSYWMTLRNGEGTGSRKRKHYIAVCGELTLEDSADPY
jgi:hypothetical protein